MSTITRFEDILVWQKAQELCKKVHLLTIKDKFSRDFKLRDQITGSSGSVMDNIAEAYERDGNKEFIQFLYIAKASNGECQSQLYRAMDSEYISSTEFAECYELASEIKKMILSFINKLKSIDHKGIKYKL